LPEWPPPEFFGAEKCCAFGAFGAENLGVEILGAEYLGAEYFGSEKCCCCEFAAIYRGDG
jgi:hypothetical protein